MKCPAPTGTDGRCLKDWFEEEWHCHEHNFKVQKFKPERFDLKHEARRGLREKSISNFM
jgi:hypothetical protein